MTWSRKDYGPSRRGGEVERRIDRLVSHLGARRMTRAQLCDELAARLGGKNRVEATLEVAKRRQLVWLDTGEKPGRFSLTSAGAARRDGAS